MSVHLSPLRSRRPLRTPVGLATFAAIATFVGGCGGDRVAGADQRVPANLGVQSGAVATARVATDVSTLPVFRVTDAEGEPVMGAVVRFSASHGGAIVGDSVHSSASGFASPTRWTLGSQAVVQTLTARVGTLAPAAVTVRATADVPATVTRVAGLGQDAVAGAAVGTPPAVRVSDRFGNAVPLALVTFAVTAGGGSIPLDTVRTDSSGVAAVGAWTLGTVAGENTLTATVGTLPFVSFSAIGTSGTPASVSVVLGGGLSATVGSALTAAPTVRVTDANGNPVGGVTITFAPAAGSGTVTVASVATDADGRASAGTWTLGTIMGVHVLNVTVPGLAPLMITATATAGAPANVAAHAGNALVAVAGSAVATAPAVRVTDVHGNVVQGVAVTFAVTAGNGSIATTSTQTSDAGIASAGSWTLGAAAGANALTATVSGLAPVTFTATGIAGAAATIAIVAGDSQAVAAGSAVTTAPSVRVRDLNGNVVPGVAVLFSVETGGGSIGGANATTDAAGVATLGSWTLGTSAGSNTLLATVGALPAVRFTATARAGTAASIAKHAGDSLFATVATSTVAPPAVLVRDAFGNAVPGIAVTFAVASGGGTVGATSTTTDAAGIATAGSWTLGTTAGTQTATATVAGIAPLTFTATATPGAPAAIAKLQGDGQEATAGTAVAIAPSVRVADAYGNPIASAQVGFTVSSGGGSITGATALTNASGVAAVGSWTLGTTAGANALGATTPGLAPVSFSATGIPGGAAGLSIFGGNGGSAQVGTTRELAVRAADIHGNGVEGLAVTWATAAGSVAPAGSLTDANGVARTTWTFGATAGTQTATASVPLLAGSPATFTVTATPSSATRLAIVQQPSDSARSGGAFARQPVIELRDDFGNAVAQAGVQVTAALASGSPALGGTTTVSTAANGRATFDGLAITGEAGVRTIGFSASSLTSTTSSPIFVGHGSAVALRFVVEPSAVASGTAIAPAVELEVVDASGNRVLDAAGSVGVSILAQAGYSASLSGTTSVALAAGRAVFSNLVASGSAGLAYTLRASTGALTASSTTFAIRAGAASATTSPLTVDDASLVANGSSFTTVRLQLRDAQGNALGSGAGYSAAFSATAGTISNVTNVGDGTFTARLTAPATAGSATISAMLNGAAVTQQRTVAFVAGPVASFRVEKLGGGDIGFAGVNEAFQVQVTALDAQGNTATTFGGAVSFSTTPSATITQGATSASFSSGVLATHTVAIGAAGSYTLTATRSGGPESGTSAAFVVDAAPTIASVVPAVGATNVSRTGTIALTFSEPVNAGAGSFTLQCPSGTPQAFTLSASPATTFTLTPTAALPGGATCVVRTSVAGGAITDVDAYDPPDGIADGTWAQFTTASAISLVNDDWTADATRRVTGNVIFESANAATPFGVTDNDTLPTTASVSFAGWIVGATAAAGRSEQGGNVAVTSSGASRGRFTYDPPAGFEGTDRFTYIVTDGTSADTATVSLSVSGMIWFVNNAATACTSSAAGCGRLTTPYSTLAALNAQNDGTGSNPADGDNIFVYESATSHTVPLGLRARQKLIGQDATQSLSQITGLVPSSGSRALPAMDAANATRVRITAADRVVALGTDNTLRGLTIVPTSEMLGSGIGGTNFGTLTLAGDVSVDGVGATAIVLSNGTISGSFASVRSTGGVAGGVMLTNVGTSGTTTFGVASDTLRSTTSALVIVNGGNGSFVFPGVVTNTSTAIATGISIQNVTGGAITFTGRINDPAGVGGAGIRIMNNQGGTFTFAGPGIRTRSSIGIDLQNNTGATVAFTGGGLDVFGTTSSVPFNAVGGGTLLVLDPTNRNELSSNMATALNVTGMTIDPAGLNFTKISAVGTSGGFTSMSGIVIASTTGTGGLTVSGTGTAGSGGNISFMNGYGVSVASASSPFRLRLAWMNLTSNNNGIRVNGPHDAVVRRTSIASTGSSPSTYGVSISGGGSVTNSFTLDTVSITNSFYGAIQASASGGTTGLTVRGSTITGTNATSGGSLVDVSGGAPVNISISGSTLSGGLVNQFRYSGMGGGQIRLDGNTISRTAAPMYTSSELVRIQPGVGGTQTAGLTYDVSNNTFPSAVGTAAIYTVAAGVGSGVEIAGRIRNNRIGTAGVASSCYEGITVENYGSGIHTALVTDNVITMCASRALYATMWGSSIPTTGSRLNATFRGNTVSSAVQGLGASLSGTANVGRTLCLDASTNSLAASSEPYALNINFFVDASTVQLPGYTGSSVGGSATTHADIVNYLRARNSTSAAASQASSAAGTQIQGAAQGISACPVPTF